MIDLHKLHIFTVTAQEGSFSKAAERLYITQSAVSQHVHELEGSVGAPLFQRSKRGVMLTPAGEILREYAQRIFALVQEAENAVSDVSRLTDGQVIIGATPGISMYRVPQWVQAFRQRYPDLTVLLNTGTTYQIIEQVLDQKVQVGFIEGELSALAQKRLENLSLDEVEQYVVVGQNHPWWTRQSVALPELDEKSFIMRPQNSQTRSWLDGILKQNHVRPQIGAEFDNLEAMKRAVASGTCLAVLPRYVIEDELAAERLRMLSVEPTPLKRVLKLIWVQAFAPPTRAFLRQITEAYPALNRLLN